MVSVNKNGYIVYQHISPCGKIYIGITHLKPEHRWGREGNGYINNEYFSRAIQKYGWDNFEHEILFDGLTKEEAEQKEIELIAKYKSNNHKFGYNISNGGNHIGKHSDETRKKLSEINIGKKHSDETKRKMSKTRKGKKQTKEHIDKRANAIKGKPNIKIRGENHHAYGKHLSMETKMKISKAKYGKKGNKVSEEFKKKLSDIFSISVCQYDLEGNLIKQYKSIKEAGLETNINTTNITSCCKKKRKTTGGYIWRYSNENLTNEDLKWINAPKREKFMKPVIQYNMSGDFIGKYNSLKDAADKNGFKNSSNILYCCNGKTKSAYGYIWKYAD